MRTLLIKLGLFTAPIFLVWYFTLSYLWLPIVVGLSDSWISHQYARLGAQIEYSENEGPNGESGWQVVTIMFKADRSYNNNTYAPQLTLNHGTRIWLGDLTGYISGLPLFWLLILLVSQHRFRHLVAGTLVVLGVASLAIITLASLNISNFLLEHPLSRILTSWNIVLVPQVPAEWLPKVLKSMRDVLTLSAILIIPVMLAWYMGRRFLRHQLLAYCLVRESEQVD